MTGRSIRCAIAAVALLFLSVSPAQDLARMDQAVQQRVAAGQFTGAVLVAQGDRVLFDKAYGEANREWHVANTTDTRFKIGSITKQFTAAAILLLEERGKLRTADPIKKYFRQAPAAWDAVTLQHLLTHTSGIPDYTGLDDFSRFMQLPLTPAELIARFAKRPLEFAPGEKMAYSNSGYVLLGYVIDEVSASSYGEFLQENIFVPLGMQDTGYDSHARVLPRRAAGYALKKGEVVNDDYFDADIAYAAGALYSTTADLLRWQRALYRGELLSAESLRKMTTPFKDTYGFGINVCDGGRKSRFCSGERRAYGHAGGAPGFVSMLEYYPDSQVTVAVLGNMMTKAPTEIAVELGQLAHQPTSATGRDSPTDR